ncbi:MAG TPA: hydrogenase expression/formation C-terminal domain-containing protein [Rubrivivax sp.]|nr:hydrogenase expression/formation C-terminal domain-containing protein [Rubrivivax sp.]
MDALTPMRAPAFGEALAAPLLHEVLRALESLARDASHATVIDLRSLPLDEAARSALRGRLGRGEVEATLDVAGTTRIEESAYAGVWWVCHLAAEGAGAAAALEQIVVARVPELLLAHPEDVAEAAQRLAGELAATPCGAAP